MIKYLCYNQSDIQFENQGEAFYLSHIEVSETQIKKGFNILFRRKQALLGV